MKEDMLTEIFGDKIPAESFLEKTHPIGKLISMLFFPIIAICFYGSYYTFFILTFYLLLLSLNYQNPFKPWFVWIFVIIMSLLVYYIFPENTFFEKFTLLAYSEFTILIFLIIAPFTHITKTLNPYELLQTLPKKMNWVGIIIIAFIRYLSVAKQQFIQTKLAFRYRNINITSVIPLFVTTLLNSVLRHSAKFADNVEIRNLDNPKLLYDKPTYGVNDFILFGLYTILIIVGVLYVYYFKDFLIK